ncbi:37S ribosomal protein S24, mitochondrial [Apophysomyces sp. BC1034]|nr:37S ribosomal protein S24, mitochondrial [Apophysomyces sp. BC1015]KAG0171344.1 37S ribosomal protein S24, mitochondrial [Apophysomyces sp. BC1021]KAG0184844.1 37S ribosomal protein S24, mitochondrial [Apophysomyces sp. BC1034]
MSRPSFSIARAAPALTGSACRMFSSASVAMAGRQGGRFRKPDKKYDVNHMEKFEFDDQTTIGHELFENIREVRRYLRKTEYELPKLSAFAKPFEPPSSDQILKFKSHTYLGEGHPVERKVVLTVKVSDLKLTDAERHKLLLLSGPRYDVNTDEIKLSSEKFPHRKQNKKIVSDILDALVAEAKDATDSFADVPLDLPQPKKKLVFPAEWARPAQQQIEVQVESVAETTIELDQTEEPQLQVNEPETLKAEVAIQNEQQPPVAEAEKQQPELKVQSEVVEQPEAKKE